MLVTHSQVTGLNYIVDHVVKNWALPSVCLLSYGCKQEV